MKLQIKGLNQHENELTMHFLHKEGIISTDDRGRYDGDDYLIDRTLADVFEEWGVDKRKACLRIFGKTNQPEVFDRLVIERNPDYMEYFFSMDEILER